MDWVPLAGIAVGFGLLVVIPVIAIMTEHQRKMARILRGEKSETAEKLEGLGVLVGAKVGGGNDEILQELRALRAEVTDLRGQVRTLTSENQAAEDELRRHLTP